MSDAPNTAELTEEVTEPEPDVVYQLLGFRFGVGEADFHPEGEEPRTEPVVLFDSVLVEAGTEHTVNARLVLAGATSALVGEEATEAAHSLLGLILARAGVEDATSDDAPEGEKGESA